MNHQEMSDQKINLLVGQVLGMDVSLVLSLLDAYDFPIGGRAEQWVKNNKTGVSFDPCTSWADAGPIIKDNKISLNYCHHEGEWIVHIEGLMNEGCWCWAIDPEYYSYSNNPLRAAMIVFLMMKDGE